MRGNLVISVTIMSEKEHQAARKWLPLECETFRHTFAAEAIKDVTMARMVGDNIIPTLAREVRKAFIIKGASIQGGIIFRGRSAGIAGSLFVADSSSGNVGSIPTASTT